MGMQLPELQQYWSVLNTVHGLLQPPGARKSFGHCPLMSAVHLMPLEQSPEFGLNSIGRLNPSTRDISKKSRLLN